MQFSLVSSQLSKAAAKMPFDVSTSSDNLRRIALRERTHSYEDISHNRPIEMTFANYKETSASGGKSYRYWYSFELAYG